MTTAVAVLAGAGVAGTVQHAAMSGKQEQGSVSAVVKLEQRVASVVKVERPKVATKAKLGELPDNPFLHLKARHREGRPLLEARNEPDIAALGAAKGAD